MDLAGKRRFEFSVHLEKSPVLGTDGAEVTSDSDALVFFGATGDLAFKQIFPALQAMTQHGHLDVPVIGVAKPEWSDDQLRARARESLEQHAEVDEEDRRRVHRIRVLNSRANRGLR